MRRIKILALAAVTAGLSLALPALAHSGPRPLVTASHAAVPAVPASPASPASPGGPTTPPAVPKPGHHSTWTWPLVPPPGATRPVIVHRFEPPAQRWQSGHRGVDLLGGAGQEVLAAGAGTVSYAGVLFGRPVVAVDHTAPGRDTLRTTYEPVDPSVKVGDKVHGGQVVGHLVDSDASHCAPRACLHWGLVRGFGHAERYLDPSALVERGPVRLLPVWAVR